MKRKINLETGFVIVSTILLASILISQQGLISVESTIDKSTITIGDLVTYTVIVRRAPEVQVEMPGLAVNLGAFEIRDYEDYEAEEIDGKIVQRTEYLISTFDVGEFEIPPLVIHYILPDDTTKKALQTEKLSILVESLKPSEAGDIRDIKPPLTLPRDYETLILWGAFCLGILLVGLLAIYFWRRKKKGKELFPRKVEPPRPAHEIALEDLNALKESSLLAEGKVKEFYIKISEIIRRYIEGRYFIIALEMTTFDLIENLSAAEIEPTNVQMIQEFLEICDLVKFAKYRPTEEENSTTINKAFEIVDQTKLVYVKSEVEELQPASQDAEVAAKNKAEIVENLQGQN